MKTPLYRKQPNMFTLQAHPNFCYTKTSFYVWVYENVICTIRREFYYHLLGIWI